MQQLIQTGGTDLANLVGPHAEQVQKYDRRFAGYHARHLLAKKVTVEEITVCFLIGNHALQ